MKKTLDIIYKVAYGIFFAFIAVIVLVLIMSKTSFSSGIEALIVQSGSMEPAIHTGSIVVIKNSPDYVVGDVITFGRTRPGVIPTTHRIVEIKQNGNEVSFVTKGDANSSEDMSEVKRESVIGKVLFSVPYLGYVVDMAKKPWGFAVIIGIPALVIIGDEVKNIVVELKKRKKGKEEEADDDVADAEK